MTQSAFEHPIHQSGNPGRPLPSWFLTANSKHPSRWRRGVHILLLTAACSTREVGPGDQDGAYIDSHASRPPPTEGWYLDSTPLVRGTSVTLTLRGSPPGAQIHFLASAAPVGNPPACPTQIAPTCLTLPGPVRVLGTSTANDTGVSMFILDIPAGLAADELAFQAVHGPSVSLSTVARLPVADEPVGVLVGTVRNQSQFGIGVLPGALIRIGDLTAQADDNGTFRIANVPAGDGVPVEVTMPVNTGDGVVFSTAHYTVDISPGSNTSLAAYLLEGCSHDAVDLSQGPQTLGCPVADDFSVELPANGVTYPDGTPYTGPLQVDVVHLDPRDDRPDLDSNPLRAMPGPMLGMTEEQAASGASLLLSMGAAEIRLLDAQGNPLQLAEGASANLTFRAPISEVAPDGIDDFRAYSYEEEIGRWVEHTACPRTAADTDGDGTDDTYVWTCAVDHFSWWNLDRPLTQTGCVRGRLVEYDPTGLSAPPTDQTILAGLSPVPQAGIDGKFISCNGVAGSAAYRGAYLGGATNQQGDFCVSGPNGCTVELRPLRLGRTGLRVGDPRQVSMGSAGASCLQNPDQCAWVGHLTIPEIDSVGPNAESYYACGQLTPADLSDPFGWLGLPGRYEVWGQIDPWLPATANGRQVLIGSTPVDSWGFFCVTLPTSVRQFHLERTVGGPPCFAPQIATPACLGTCENQNPLACAEVGIHQCSDTP
jgi:hypothetical protein